MSIRNALGEIVSKIVAIVKSGAGDELARERAGLAEAESQLGEARHALEQAQRARGDAMREALDGEVDSTTLGRHRATVSQAQARVDDLEQLVRALHERTARAQQNASARDVADRWARVRRHVDAINNGMRKIQTGIALIVEGAREVRESSVAASQVAPSKPVTWPMLWGPRHLEVEILMELERGDPLTFRKYGASALHSRATLEARHKGAVSEVLPPDPRPRPAAA